MPSAWTLQIHCHKPPLCDNCGALSILFYAKKIVKISPCLKCLINSLQIPLGYGISTWWCRVLWWVTVFKRPSQVSNFSGDLVMLTWVGHLWSRVAVQVWQATFVEVCWLYPEEYIDYIESEQQNLLELCYCSACTEALSTLRGEEDITAQP